MLNSGLEGDLQTSPISGNIGSLTIAVIIYKENYMAIYIAARDLAGLPIGTHQFIIIENQSNPHPAAKLNNKIIYPKNLGNGKLGYVVGAQNRGNLAVEFFEKSDYEATLEYFDKKRLKFYKSDFDTEALKVTFPNINEKVAVIRLFRLIDAYNTNQTMDIIRYPTAGLGFNSNSWAQTIIELTGGKIRSDLKGFDISNKKRIPKTYFDPICLQKPRPVIN